MIPGILKGYEVSIVPQKREAYATWTWFFETTQMQNMLYKSVRQFFHC